MATTSTSSTPIEETELKPDDAGIFNLPIEVIHHVFGFLDLMTVLKLRNASKELTRMVDCYISSLRTLRISSVAPAKLHAVNNVMLEGLFANKWPSLIRLEFDGSKVPIEPLSIDVMAAVFQNCPSLVTLTVEADVANDELQKKVALPEKAGRLRYFRWFGSSRHAKRFEQLICQATPVLSVAHLHSLPSVVMVSLRQLVLERWPSVASAPLDAAWSRLPCLESLIVYWGRRSNAVRHLAALSAACRRLHELMVIDSDLVDNDLSVLPRGKLRRLDLLYNYLLTDNGIEKIVAASPDLTSLGLSNVIDVSEHSLLAVGRGCPKLEELAVCGCSKIDNGAIETLARARVSLQESLSETDLPVPWLTVYAASTKVDKTKDWPSATTLARARMRVITCFDDTHPVLLVPLRSY